MNLNVQLKSKPGAKIKYRYTAIEIQLKNASVNCKVMNRLFFVNPHRNWIQNF